MQRYFLSSIFFGFLFIWSSCENREVNADDGPNFREIHEEIAYHFDIVQIDGISYYLLERDRNNPHEGFGFMALDGRVMRSKHDSTLAYLKTLYDLQIRMTAKVTNIPLEQSEKEAGELLNYYLDQIDILKDTSKARLQE